MSWLGGFRYNQNNPQQADQAIFGQGEPAGAPSGQDPNNLLVPEGTPDQSFVGDQEELHHAQEPVIMTFEEENGVDKANALSEALKTLASHKFDVDDLHFTLNQIETRMAAAGVKKQFTKLQVLATLIPPQFIKQVKPILRKTEAEFTENDAYKTLKQTIIRIFGPKKDARMQD